MPHYIQGDIFAASNERHADLAIIFGHIGLNEMRLSWRSFADRMPRLAHIRDPFSEMPCEPYQYSDGRWLWFFSGCDNHGMTDAQLESALEQALSWAQANDLRTVITNGIANTDHGHDTITNRQSDDSRVRFISGLAGNHERTKKVDITLISLNDAFVRNVA